ncbi:MAG: succinate dehydrogenase assembly factor 2 [Alphaproteobacteria bacterium]
MNEETEQDIRRKRLKFRAWHRGMREVDLLLGGFADKHLHAFSPEQLGQFEQVLDIEDPYLYAWLSGAAPLPEAENTPVMNMIINFKYTI